MLIIRYAAFFKADRENAKYFAELALSIVTVERFVGPFADTKIVIFTLDAFASSIESFLSKINVPHEVVALDRLDPERYSENKKFADSLSNLTEVDRICTIRMLSDFEYLSNEDHRLLIGTDVFFFDCPQEVLAFAWGPNLEKNVLYMQDLFTFGGAEYGIRYYHPPILKSLLGDFYCLSPGVALERSAIIGCMKMVNSWPVHPSRFDPPSPSATTPEQHTAAILLQPFRGEALPSARYSHVQFHSALAVLHTHDIGLVLRHSERAVVERFTAVTGFDVK